METITPPIQPPTPRTNWKRIVAREWLVLVGCFLIAFTVCVVLAFTVKRFNSEPIEMWLSLYGLVQFIRSIIWACKTLRRSR